MGILPLKKRVNRDKCSFATKQRIFGVFAIDEILRYRGTQFPGSCTLCHPAACFLLKINKWFHTRFPTFLFWLLDGMQRKEGPLQEFPLSAVVSHLSKTNTIDKMLETWEIKTRWLLTNDRNQNVSSGCEVSESFHPEIT